VKRLDDPPDGIEENLGFGSVFHWLIIWAPIQLPYYVNRPGIVPGNCISELLSYY
jgi:hypothetical protein